MVGAALNESRPILVVDDTDDIRETLQMVLEDSGYKVLTAAHGEDAIRQLQEERLDPGLVILDLNMAILDGKGFLEQRQRLGLIPETAVLILAAVRNEFPLEGIRGWLKKPIAMEDLLAAVEAHYAR